MKGQRERERNERDAGRRVKSYRKEGTRRQQGGIGEVKEIWE